MRRTGRTFADAGKYGGRAMRGIWWFVCVAALAWGCCADSGQAGRMRALPARAGSGGRAGAGRYPYRSAVEESRTDGGLGARDDIASLLSLWCARLRAGASVSEAIDITTIRAFRVGSMHGGIKRMSRWARAMRVPSGEDDSVRLLRHAAMVRKLVERTGCSAVTCCEALLREHRRMMVLRRQAGVALAMPQATMRLLAVLPLGSILCTELMGIHTWTILVGSVKGWCCLAVGLVCYAAGLAWVQALIRHMGDVADRVRQW